MNDVVAVIGVSFTIFAIVLLVCRVIISFVEEHGWPYDLLPKLCRPPRGTHWELRASYGNYKDMHLVDKDGTSLGSFIAFGGDGSVTRYWRSESRNVVAAAKRHPNNNWDYSPELAGYTIKKPDHDF